MSEENKEKKVITKDMTFKEILEIKPDAAYALMDMGMMCGGCPMSQFETVEDGANVHGADSDAVLKRLNE